MKNINIFGAIIIKYQVQGNNTGVVKKPLQFSVVGSVWGILSTQ